MLKPDFKKANFLLSVAKLSQLPSDEGREVAFVGRSNAGKSSVINSLTQNKQLVRVSKTPGRTQLLNYFGLGNTDFRLVDLPGYGYAAVPPAVKQHWEHLVNAYLQKRQSLAGLVLVMDCRHPMRPLDHQLLCWCQAVDVPVHILLNKADKLSQSAAKKTLKDVAGVLTIQYPIATCQLFSASKGLGLDGLQTKMCEYLASCASHA